MGHRGSGAACGADLTALTIFKAMAGPGGGIRRLAPWGCMGVQRGVCGETARSLPISLTLGLHPEHPTSCQGLNGSLVPLGTGFRLG